MMDERPSPSLEGNRLHWNDRADIHVRDSTGFYRVAAFKAGADTLTPIESAEIGIVSGRRLLHLQCHFGLDTLSLARRGALVTGLDFSDRAITAARGLASDLALPATFVCGDVHDTRALVPGTFDIVFATWGVFCWIPDVARWTAVAASMLAPGGRLYIADDHPTAGQLEEETGLGGPPRLVVTEHWRTPLDRPNVYTAGQTYTGDPTPIAHASAQEWAHPISAFLGALPAAGLDLDWFHEHETIPWQRYPSLVSDADDAGMWRFAPGRRGIPLAFSLMAHRRI